MTVSYRQVGYLRMENFYNDQLLLGNIGNDGKIGAVGKVAPLMRR